MKGFFYIFILIYFLITNVYANDKFIYQYQIFFNKNQSTSIGELKDLIKRFAHTDEVEILNDEKSIELKTIYKINEIIFKGKFEKHNCTIENIILKNKFTITDEAKDKIEKTERLIEAERLKKGK